jgi:predicted  nucleic acid-binding Zn-ribbon protein
MQQRLDAETAQVKQLNTQLAEAQANAEEALQNERQTISLLVSEKASLTEELERLNSIESRA